MAHVIVDNDFSIDSVLAEAAGVDENIVQVYLTDLSGEIIHEQRGTQNIDLSEKRRGKYIAFMVDNNHRLIRKIGIVKNNFFMCIVRKRLACVWAGFFCLNLY